MEAKDWVTVTLSLVSIVVAVASIYMTGRQAEKTRALQQQFEERQTTLENRRFFTTHLFDKVIALNNIDPNNPISVDVRNIVNTLEMVAMCWESETVDRQMVVLSFGRLFDELYGQVEAVKSDVPGLHRTGYQLLTQNPVLPKVRKQIQEALHSQGTIKPA